MSRASTKVVRACYKADSTDLETVLSLALQRFFIQKLVNDHTRDVHDKMDDA